MPLRLRQTAAGSPPDVPTAPTPARGDSARKPLLASEVMVADQAPLEPWHRGGRLGLLGAALLLTALGSAVWAGFPLPHDAASSAFGAAAACLLIALLPFSYPVRAILTAVVSAGLMLLGLEGAGPLAGLAIDGGQPRDLVRLLVATTLPAALFVRGRYPSFPATRTLLGVVLALSLPLLWLEGTLALAPGVHWAVRAAAALAALALVVSGAGMGRCENLGATSPWAWIVLGALPLGIGARALTPLADSGVGGLVYPATGLAMAGVTTLGSLALAQLLATLIGPRARARLRERGRPTGERRLNHPPS